MDLNRIFIQREGYDVLDLLSDIGGMQGMITQLALVFLAFWNFNTFDNYLVTRLYKLRSPVD